MFQRHLILASAHVDHEAGVEGAMAKTVQEGNTVSN